MRIAESLYMDGYISYPRVDNTVYPPSLDLAETVKRIAGNPAYAPYCKELLAKAVARVRRAARRRPPTIRPSILRHAATPDDLPAGGIQAVQPDCAPFLGHALRSGRGGGHASVPLTWQGETFVAQAATCWCKPGFRAIYPYGLKKDEQLPALYEGQADRLQWCHLHEEAD